MASITAICPGCSHSMKFSADKEGKRAKCPKCGASVPIVAVAFESPKPEPEPAPAPKPYDEFADDGPANYDATVDPELEIIRKRIEAEEKEAKKRKKKDKSKLANVARKVKAIPDAELWDKVRFGLLFFAVGILCGLAGHVLQGTAVLIGSVEFSEYATLIAEALERRGGADEFPENNGFWDIELYRVYLGMVSGRKLLDFAHACMIFSTVFQLLMQLSFGAGQAMCLYVPNRYGTFGQVAGMMALTVFNFLTIFIFRFLPAVGAIDYVMIPFVIPEIVLTEYNMERMVPIHILWSGSPFWEFLMSFIFYCMLYIHPALGCIFIWSSGMSIKEDAIAESGKGMTRLALGTCFTFIAFILMSVCGASPVLVRLLRLIYVLAFLFWFLFCIRFALMMMHVRSVLYEKINPKNLDE